MSEYTPTTGDVRAAYNQLITGTRPHELPHDYPCPEFDRWLTQHDLEVAAKAKYELLMMQLENVRLEVEAERAQEATNE